MSALDLGKIDSGAYGQELLRVWPGLATLLVGTGTAKIGMVGTSDLVSWNVGIGVLVVILNRD